jgi:uncharacterized protein (DUF736 family)
MADSALGGASAVADDKAPRERTPRIADRYVRLDRSTDRERPCCENLATLRPGKGPHAAELRCAGCGGHRGWLPKQALAAIGDRLGDPDPIILHDQTIGDFVLKKFDNSNSGALFKNENKQSEKHADYRGEINAAGVDYWLDGWVRTSKKGTKFISFKLKPKDDQPNRVKESVAKDFDDDLPWMP